LVLVGSSSGIFYALNVSDGSFKWQYQTGGEISTTAAASSDTVYFCSKDAKLYALDLASGAAKWQWKADFEVVNSPAVSQGVVYIGHSSTLHAFDAASGKQVWAVPVGDVDASGNVTTSDSVSAGVGVAGDAIFVPSGNYLYAFSARATARYVATSGQPAYAWRFKVPSKTFDNSSTPVVGTGVVYFAADNGTIYALKTA
jgi:outer membrane protein assembly factor BamB